MDAKEEVSNEKILEYIDIISNSFGLRRDAPMSLIKEMQKLFAAKEFSRCILKIKLFFNLPMTLRIGYLRDKNSPPGAHGFNSSNFDVLGGEFLNPLSLLCDPKRDPASVLIPCNLPPYGHPAFEKITITMYIDNRLKSESFETFAKCVGHEMAHIVLFATRHQLKESEIATDLAAMVLGFSEIFRKGRKSACKRFGYLDDYQFVLAYRAIRKKQGNGFFGRWFGI
jgi:hypothetical protein